MEGALTKEKFRKKFVNQFELVNHAIKLAENMIRSGRPPRVIVDGDNPAVAVLAEIEEGKDQLVDIATFVHPDHQHDKKEVESREHPSGKEKLRSIIPGKSSEKKTRTPRIEL
jgi:DNA-directed RNA polymerase subunit K/omega